MFSRKISDILAQRYIDHIQDLYERSLNADECAFTKMVKELASLTLYGTGIEIVLQRDLNH